jgi:hypothetical protein
MNRGMIVYSMLISVLYIHANSVQKVVYCAQTEPNMLQVGALELYCVQAVPFEALISGNDTDKKTIALTLPDLVFGQSDREKINAIKGAGYHVALRHDTRHQQLVITYDPTYVFVTYAPTLSIDMQHGIVVRFFDQVLLRTMRSQDKPVLCVACL